MTSCNFTKNQAKVEDIKKHLLQCSELFSPVLGSYVNISEYSKKIRDHAVTIEAWSSNELIGLVACYLNDYNTLEGYITNVSVIRECQGKGIAKQLIKNTIEVALNKNFNTLRLEVEVDNNLAIELYKQTDFVLNGRKGNKYLMINRLLENQEITVSISCVTYNHAAYIRNAIDGFLMQKTNFPIEVLIHDDASTDGTAGIIKEYEEKYSDLIKPIYQRENQYSQGRTISAVYQFPRARGKYIALCEGDDYWTDPHKLQKQVDFLETNAEYVFTFHDALILNQKTGEKRVRVGNRTIDTTVDLKSLIIQKNIPTASIVFRNILDFNSLPDWFNKISNGDYGLCVLLAEEGPGKYLPDVMSVYRVHEGGVWSGNGFEFTHNSDLQFYNYLLDYFKDKDIRKTIRAKIRWSRFNYGISNIRQGRIIEGLFHALINLRLRGDQRLRTNPRKIASAIKTALKRGNTAI